MAAPAHVGGDLAHQRNQVRWFGGMVGNHVADIVGRYGDDSNLVPPASADYIKVRKGYDYSHHGKVGNPDAAFAPTRSSIDSVFSVRLRTIDGASPSVMNSVSISSRCASCTTATKARLRRTAKASSVRCNAALHPSAQIRVVKFFATCATERHQPDPGVPCVYDFPSLRPLPFW